MISTTLITLGVLVLSIAIAGAFIKRNRSFVGILVGLLPIAAMEICFQWFLYASVQDCIDRACASAGLPPGCDIAEFGCTEWSGLAVFMFYAAGFIAVVLYLLVVIVWAVVPARRRSKIQGEPLPPEEGQA
jgi:ABC-type antimicrobial peptide transport system permease subunit